MIATAAPVVMPVQGGNLQGCMPDGAGSVPFEMPASVIRTYWDGRDQKQGPQTETKARTIHGRVCGRPDQAVGSLRGILPIDLGSQVHANR